MRCVACRNALDPWIRDAVRTAGLAVCWDAAMDCRESDRWTIEDAEKAAVL